jgi:hypothetical protein
METEYFPDNVTAVRNSFFTYNSQYLLPGSTKIVSSKGDSIVWQTKYPFDYSDAINQEMVGKSIVGVPIESISQINNLVKGASRASYQDTLGMYVLKRLAANTLRSDTRLKNAQVTTYTYKPSVGMTSETEISGRTVYYDYDSSGRLLRRCKHFGNTQKEYNYNYHP